MKFSIVTPTFNSQEHLEETIQSVISQQGDFEIDYIIVDGGSTDKTVEIIKRYDESINNRKQKIFCNKINLKWISEKDNGMYDAINKGFARATGDVYAWINSDDIYLPGAFDIMRKTFEAFPEIEWLKGITSFIKKDGKIYEHGRCFIYNQNWIKKGIYGRNAYFVHQDSVFWKKELWQKSGGANSKLKLAGDYALWINFANFTPLWSVKYEVSCFRKRAGQLSSNTNQYRKEQRSVSVEKGVIVKCVKIFFWLQTKRPQWLNPAFTLFYKLAFRDKNKYFIDINSNGIPEKKKTNSYVLSK